MNDKSELERITKKPEHEFKEMNMTQPIKIISTDGNCYLNSDYPVDVDYIWSIYRRKD